MTESLVNDTGVVLKLKGCAGKQLGGERPLIERFGLLIRPEEEWMLNAHGLSDEVVKQMILDKRAKQRLTGHGKPRVDPVTGKTKADVEFLERQDVQRRNFNLARAELPMGAIENPMSFWSSPSLWDVQSRAKYWAKIIECYPPLPWRFESVVKAVLHTCGRFNLNKEKLAGNQTVSMKFEHILRFVKGLEELGFKLTSPAGLKKKHLVAYIQSLENGSLTREGNRAAPKTLQTAHSNVSALYTWMGRESEIVKLRDCVLDPVSADIEFGVKKGATPDENEFDAGDFIDRLTADPSNRKQFLFGFQVGAMEIFGLRLSEVLKLKPLLDISIRDSVVRVRQGKGGLARDVPLTTAREKAFAKRLLEAMPLMFGEAAESHFLAPDTQAEHKLLANKQQWYRCTAEFGFTKNALGFTGHGFRKEYAVETLRVNGVRLLMEEPNFDKQAFNRMFESVAEEFGLLEAPGVLTLEQEHSVIKMVSERLGHHRVSVIGAYAKTMVLAKGAGAKRMTKGQVSEFVVDYSAGMSVDDLMIKFSIKRDSVYRKAKENGLCAPLQRTAPDVRL
jgi:integrase